MSGGSMNYAYCRVQEIRFAVHTPLRRAFAAHVELVAKALHDIEWLDSGDCSPGQEDDAIRACLAHSYAESLRRELRELIAEATKEAAK